jgi:hypothetical protein
MGISQKERRKTKTKTKKSPKNATNELHFRLDAKNSYAT